MRPTYEHRLTVAGAAIEETFASHGGQRTLQGILVAVDTAPTTSENLVVSLDSAYGEEHDVAIYTKDMSGVADIMYTDIGLPLVAGDALRVTYANSDGRTVGLRLLLED